MPDGLHGRVLKVCANQLASVFTWFLHGLSNTHSNSRSASLKISRPTIISIPKKSSARQFNEFWPVALTSVIAKCMERSVCDQLISSMAHRMDSLQFAYKAKRSVEDTTSSLLNLISSQLDFPGTAVRVLFMNFSYAFNTIQPQVLIIM